MESPSPLSKAQCFCSAGSPKIALLDQAVRAVSELDEDYDMNPLAAARSGSPDHADAAMWALTHLFGADDGTGIIEFYRREAEGHSGA